MCVGKVEDLPSGYCYLPVSNSDREFIFRIKEVNSEEIAQVWLEKFSQKTQLTWRKAKTYPDSGRLNVFKVDLRCSHCTDRRVQGKKASKHTGCPAKMQIIIRRHYPNSTARSKDPLTKEWPAIVTLKENHNHATDNAAVLKYRDMSEETKTKLRLLFRKGHNPASALLCLKTDLMLEHGDEYYKIAADGFYVPSSSIIHKFFEKEFTAEYGKTSGESMLKDLQIQLESYSESSSGNAKLCKTADDQHYFVVICTPIMVRVHQMAHQASELVLLDASGGMDKQRHRVYFFITPTAAGGLPLGVIITDTEKESVFDEAVKELKNILPKESFYHKNFPETFLTDNDLKERNPLRKHFPLSKVLLCQFHMLKAVWSWLCDKNHDVDSSDRQELYFLFKAVLYASREVDFTAKHQSFPSSEKACKYPNLIDYYTKLYLTKEDWALCYRKNLKLRGSNTTNFVEVVFRIMKDCILGRVMAFNLTQLVDFILSRYEMYMEKRLIDFFNGRSPKPLLKNILAKEENADMSVKEISKLEGLYNVFNRNNKQNYTVDTLSGICSCSDGLSGKICAHAASVLLNIDDVANAFNVASLKSKEIMFRIALGKQPSVGWLQPLNSYPCTSAVQNSSNIEVLDQVISDDHLFENANSSEAVMSPPAKAGLSAEEQEEFMKLLNRIENGIKTNPEVFVPAAKKMLKNVKDYAETDVGLVSAMHTFGTYRGLASAHKNRFVRRRNHALTIGVQPTAIGRRKNCLTGKKKISSGRPRGSMKVHPALKSHDYTTSGILPSRKRKAPHSIQECVLSNKSLGATKHAKS